MTQEVKLLTERQEVLKGMVGDKIRLQSRATEKYYEQMFGDEGAGRKEIESGSDTCAEKAHVDEISE